MTQRAPYQLLSILKRASVILTMETSKSNVKGMAIQYRIGRIAELMEYILFIIKMGQ